MSIMISVSKPYKEEREGQTYLLTHVVDETRQWDDELWFSVNPEYGEGLCDDYADAFLLLALLPAIKSGQDIRVEGRVSRKLLFNIRNTIQPIFNKVLDAPRDIRIEAQAADDILYHAKGVGCGCSLGVDSLNAFFEHFNPDTTEGYRVTHLTLFNSGQLGDIDLVSVLQNFHRSVKELEPFSQAVGLPVLAVNSNMNDFYMWSGITLLQSFVTRTCACAMALQKLLGRYVYASSYDLPQMEFSTHDCSHMEAAYAPLLSTENFELSLSNPMKTRVMKTDYIRTNPLTPKFLQVCWAEQFAYNHLHNTMYLEGKTKTNCGWCDKCLRTLLALEILQGDISLYGDIFELSKYRETKEWYIHYIFNEYHDHLFYQELIELMIERNYPVPAGLLERYKRERAGLSEEMTLRKLAGKVRRLPRRAARACKRCLKGFLKRPSWFREIQMSRAIRRFIRTQWHRPIWGEGLYGENLDKALAAYLSESERKDTRLVKKLTRDMVKCYLLYGATPDEYFLFNFRNASDEVRASFVTDMDKDKTLMQSVDVKMYERELQDKYAFYKRAGEFFKREACPVAGVEDWDAFRQLAAHGADVFVKPLDSSYGRGAASLHLETEEEARRAFDSLLAQGGKWIAEEKIRQSAAMARWNESSVNTVRMPSFRTEQGYKIMTPSLRCGAGGSIVDNGGAGGIIINIDKETGVLVTDGGREDNTVYAKHPDSGVPFKGERLPEWESLVELTRKVHALFPPHRYIAFDFAHTDKGWVLVEGNWGQLISQYVDKVGRKKEWHELMGC